MGQPNPWTTLRHMTVCETICFTYDVQFFGSTQCYHMDSTISLYTLIKLYSGLWYAIRYDTRSIYKLLTDANEQKFGLKLKELSGLRGRMSTSCTTSKPKLQKKQPETKAISVEKLEQRKNRELNSNRFRTDQSINQFIKSKRTNRPLTSQ